MTNERAGSSHEDHRCADAYLVADGDAAVGPASQGREILARMQCSYRQCVSFFTEELPWLGAADLEDVMGRGLCAWIGWDYKFQQ
jgi:hypothetical protein